MSAPEKGHSGSHSLEWDPPAGLTAARRWTCTRCGATLIDYRGNVYGDAVDILCTAATEENPMPKTEPPHHRGAT